MYLNSFEATQKFTIRGLGKNLRHESNARHHEQLLIDREYVFLPRYSKSLDREGNLYFRLRGYLYSEINWSIESNRWKITSSHTGRTVALPNMIDEDIAIGKYEWEFMFKYLDKSKTDKSNSVIKITQVLLNK